MRQPLAGFMTRLTDCPRRSVSLRVVPYLTPLLPPPESKRHRFSVAFYLRQSLPKSNVFIEARRRQD